MGIIRPSSIPYNPLKGPFIGFIMGIVRLSGPSWRAQASNPTAQIDKCTKSKPKSPT